MANEAARMAERWYSRHAQILNHELSSRQPLILYAAHPQFEQTNTTTGNLGEGVGGFTEPLMRRIVLPLTASLDETNHVIGHELVHAFQYDIMEKGNRAVGNPAETDMPLWFIEGMAEYLSLGPDDPHTAMWMRDAVYSDQKLPSFRDLNNPKYFPYRWGQALLAYIAGRWGEESIGNLLRASTTRNEDLTDVISRMLEIDPDSLIADWHAALRQAYKPVESATDTLMQQEQLLIGEKKGGQLNIAPAMSPDGSRLLFFSEKSQFAVDLYLADANTGKVLRKLTRLELDPHYQSMEFINSAGTWSPDGKQIAVGSIIKERPALTFIDPSTGEVIRDVRFPNLGEILNPAWSPDGRYIAFSALAGGTSDLFLYDLRDDSLQQITDDLYADLQPAWSPSGEKLAFVTDMFSTDLPTLSPGQYRLAMYDLPSKNIRQIPLFSTGKHINPQWSPDGSGLYFLSNQDGITNLYMVRLPDNHITQLTNLPTGISGITALSPALSVSSKTGRMAFSVYQKSQYNIYTMETARQNLALNAMTSPETSFLASAGIVPSYLPFDTSRSVLIRNLQTPDRGLPPDTTYPMQPYHARLKLNYVGQPYLFGGADQYGLMLGGGASLYFSDMLGYRHLVTMMQIQADNGFTDLSGAVGYLNDRSRWNWGGVIQQIPYVYRAYASGYSRYKGEDAILDEEIRYRQLNRQVSLMAQYPFNTTNRLELSGGFRQISFSSKRIINIYSRVSNNRLDRQTDNLSAPSPLNLFTTSAALVHDNSFTGATSPVLGRRFRMEVSPIIGTIKFMNLLTDFRQYLMPVRPFTIAFRAFHIGRYGGDAEDSRLTPMFLGYQSMVRGYNAGSFSARECSSGAGGTCPAFDQLIGSRIAVMNAEIRAPLFGVLGLGEGYYGLFPVETGVFYDAGLAWDSGHTPALFGGERHPVSSYGLTNRVNLFGIVVAEIDLVNPVNRPGQGWYWELGFNAGF